MEEFGENRDLLRCKLRGSLTIYSIWLGSLLACASHIIDFHQTLGITFDKTRKSLAHMPFITIFFISLGGLVALLGFKTWEVRIGRQVAAPFFSGSDRVLLRVIVKTARFCGTIKDYALPRIVYLSVKLGNIVRIGFRSALKGVRAASGALRARRARTERSSTGTTSAYFSRIAKMRHKG